MFTNTLPPSTLALLEKFKHQVFLTPFYLYGGTALSLYLGYRESEDLDFFTKESFNPLTLQSQLIPFGVLSNTELAENALNTNLNSVKLQFLHYPYSILEPPTDWNGIKISSILDIACTKIITVSMRGCKKDFIDVYFLLKQFTLPALIEAIKQKYIGIDYNTTHLLKALVYFTDADQQPMPRMHQEVSWEQIKVEITGKVKEIKYSSL
jgi:predicted nucleotidyltransferase component of viral defense system